MSNRNANLREKYLDAEKLFRVYWEMGEGRTIKLLTEWAIVNGMTSSKGNEPTPMGVWKAIWRWASYKENREKAWKIIQENSNMTRPEFEKDMRLVKIPTAWQHNTHAKRDKFLRENGWI